MSNYAQQLKEAEKSVTITPEPLIFEKVGNTWRGMYIGQTTFDKTDPKTGEIKRMAVAHFYDGEKVLFNLGAQLTRSLANIKPGVSMEITLKELKANPHGGKTKIYSVTPLRLQIADPNEIFGGVLQIAPPAASDLLPPAPQADVQPVNSTGPQYDNEADAALLWNSEI